MQEFKCELAKQLSVNDKRLLSFKNSVRPKLAMRLQWNVHFLNFALIGA